MSLTTAPKNDNGMNIEIALAEIRLFLEDACKSKATGTYFVRFKVNCGGLRSKTIYGIGKRPDNKAYFVSRGSVVELEET